MEDLDAEWKEKMAEAQARARAAGRADLVEYLTLRAANDLARTTGVRWLIDAFTELAGEANRRGASITLERREAHRFTVGNSTMVGAELTLRVGVRALMVEAGWPRTPRDGIVRGGGLASARVSHFGDRSATEDLLLVRENAGAPHWLILEKDGTRSRLVAARLIRHVARLARA